MIWAKYFDNSNEPVKGLLTYLKPHLLTAENLPVIHSITVELQKKVDNLFELRKENVLADAKEKEKEDLSAAAATAEALARMEALKKSPIGGLFQHLATEAVKAANLVKGGAGRQATTSKAGTNNNGRKKNGKGKGRSNKKVTFAPETGPAPATEATQTAAPSSSGTTNRKRKGPHVPSKNRPGKKSSGKRNKRSPN